MHLKSQLKMLKMQKKYKVIAKKTFRRRKTKQQDGTITKKIFEKTFGDLNTRVLIPPIRILIY